MNRSPFTPHAAARPGWALALVGASLLTFAQATNDSGFPRGEVDKQSGYQSEAATASPDSPAPAPIAAPPLSEENKNKAVTYRGTRNPPSNLSVVDGHYTPYNPPKPKEGEQVYTIKAGDTLWALAQGTYGSPLYWPVIWEMNDYIKDAHWIYPGDPLLLKSGAVQIAGAEPVKSPEATAVSAEEAGRDLVPEMGLPPVYAGDMYCSGYIEPEFTPSDLRVLAFSEDFRTIGREGTYVFLNQGKNKGLTPGQEYAIIRPGSPVRHPGSNSDLGLFVRRLGRGKITIVAEETSVFEITSACLDIRRGDLLVPFESRPAPFEFARRGKYPIYDAPNGKLQGTVVLLGEAGLNSSEHHIVYMNLGSKHEIAPGDRFMVYRSTRFDTLMAVKDTMRDTSSTASFSDSDLMRARAGEAIREEDIDRDDGRIKAHAADDRASDLSSEQAQRASRLPRKTIGELVVLDTTASTATCRVIHSEVELQIGDVAELQ